MNTAFVFAKPHANTPAVLDVIKAKFDEKGISVLKEGVVTGEEIDSKGFIDQHYYAIAEKSTLTSGKDLPVNAEKFEEVFSEDWKTVVSEGRALNALEFKKNFEIYQACIAACIAWCVAESMPCCVIWCMRATSLSHRKAPLCRL